MNAFDLTGRVALVTGGNSGIGAGIAHGFAAAGATVVITGRDAGKTAAVLETLRALRPDAQALALDVTDRQALEATTEALIAQHGRIDVLVNNAGNSHFSGGILRESPEVWDQTFATHSTATFLLSRAVAAHMKQQGGGKIINIASLYSTFGSGDLPSYSATKGAIVQLTKSMAVELARHNIQVNAIAPGWIMTEMTRDVPGTDFEKEVLARTPARRWGTPEDLAGTAVYLAAPASDFVTGVVVTVDGGYTVR
ncbi:MAG: glucose 1-dehydrogenase [Pseudomonadota bacterium]